MSQKYPLCEKAGLMVTGLPLGMFSVSDPVIYAADVEAYLESEQKKFREMLEPFAKTRAPKGPVGPGSEYFESVVRPKLEPQSAPWIFTAEDFGYAAKGPDYRDREAAHRANAKLAEWMKDGVRVTRSDSMQVEFGNISNRKTIWLEGESNSEDTHFGYVVAIQPIKAEAKPDTAESLLREFLDTNDCAGHAPADWMERARKLLEEK